MCKSSFSYTFSYTFYYSMSMKGQTIPESVHFHLLGLSDRDGDIPRPEDLNFESEKVWKMGTLSSIQKSLHHWKVLQHVPHRLKIKQHPCYYTCTYLPFYGHKSKKCCFNLRTLFASFLFCFFFFLFSFIKSSKLHSAFT